MARFDLDPQWLFSGDEKDDTNDGDDEDSDDDEGDTDADDDENPVWVWIRIIRIITKKTINDKYVDDEDERNQKIWQICWRWGG